MWGYRIRKPLICLGGCSPYCSMSVEGLELAGKLEGKISIKILTDSESLVFSEREVICSWSILEEGGGGGN